MRDTLEEGRANPPTREPDELGRRTVPVRVDVELGLVITEPLDGLRGTVRVRTGRLLPRLIVEVRVVLGARLTVGARPRVGVRVTVGARCTVGARLTVSTRR